VRIGEWTVPAGETIAVLVIGILSDATIYEEPDRFRPERFLDRWPGAHEFLPFGGGPRRCLGAAFAEAELAIALGTIASRWDVELADRRPERSVRRNITMGPERGVRIRVIGRRRRDGSRAGETA
jgi:cytochrome P450